MCSGFVVRIGDKVCYERNVFARRLVVICVEMAGWIKRRGADGKWCDACASLVAVDL